MQIFWSSDLGILEGSVTRGVQVFVLLSREPPGVVDIGVPPWCTGLGFMLGPLNFGAKTQLSSLRRKKIQWPLLNGHTNDPMFCLLDDVSGSFCISGTGT
jgi:hypothetical protein